MRVGGEQGRRIERKCKIQKIYREFKCRINDQFAYISWPSRESNVSIRMYFLIRRVETFRMKVASIFPNFLVTSHKVWSDTDIRTRRKNKAIYTKKKENEAEKHIIIISCRTGINVSSPNWFRRLRWAFDRRMAPMERVEGSLLPRVQDTWARRGPAGSPTSLCHRQWQIVFLPHTSPELEDAWRDCRGRMRCHLLLCRGLQTGMYVRWGYWVT